jgi:hypothetical protein
MIDQIYNPEYKTQSDDPVPLGRYELMERIKVLEDALNYIANGRVPGLSDFIIIGNWHSAFTMLQEKARAALKATEK